MVVEASEKLHLFGAGAMADGIVKDEHVDAIRMSQGSERVIDDGGGNLCRESAPVDSARVHEADRHPKETMLMNLYRYLDLISFNADDAALVISISCSTRPADDLVSVGFHTSGKGIDRFFAANAESDMDKACSGESFLVIRHFGFLHNFQSCTVAKRDEIRAETRIFVVVAIVGIAVQIFYEEILRCLQIIHIHCNMLNLHRIPLHSLIS